MRIGIIGTGSMGGILARRLAKLGHRVSIANSRGPESLTALAAEVGATPVSVVDHGEEPLVLQGRPTTTAHHYSIKTSFPQDVWYDQQHQLLKVELRGSDGSRIQYQPG